MKALTVYTWVGFLYNKHLGKLLPRMSPTHQQVRYYVAAPSKIGAARAAGKKRVDQLWNFGSAMSDLDRATVLQKPPGTIWATALDDYRADRVFIEVPKEDVKG